ncbi:MAG: ABC transporter substrate-binding protein [Bacillota bacterium]
MLGSGRRAAVIGIATCILAALACSGVFGASPVRITFWHIYSGKSADAETMSELLRVFNEQHKGRIQAEPVEISFWDFDAKYLAAIAAGTPPNVVIWDITSTAGRAAKGGLVPLDSYMKRSNLSKRDFWASALERETYRGETYSLPFSADVRVLFYNVDHFKEAGLDPAKPLVTWDDLVTYARKLTIQEGGRLARVGFAPMWGNVWFLPYVWGNDGRWFAEDGAPTINHPKNVEALEWVMSFNKSYGLQALTNFGAQFGPGLQDPFISGRVSMIIQVNPFMIEIERYRPALNWNIALIPYRTNPKAGWAAGFCLEMPKKRSNAHYDEAWELISFLLSEASQETWVKNTRSLGARPAVAQRAFPGDRRWQVVVNQMELSRFQDYVVEAPSWWFSTWSELDNAFAGRKTPKQALDEAQRAVERDIHLYVGTTGR